MRFFARTLVKTAGNESEPKKKEKKANPVRRTASIGSFDLTINKPGKPVLTTRIKKNSKQAQLLDKLSHEEIENYKKAFSIYDKNGNGTIEENELLFLMRTLGENPTEDQMSIIMHEMDTDGNGKIDFEEFLQSMAEKREMHDSMEDLRMAFQVFDQNGDGKISTSELMSTMTEISGAMTEEEALELMMEADKDGNGFIDYEELINVLFE